MRKTNNYGLVLYDSTDKMNITAEENSLNANMEIIDNELKNRLIVKDNMYDNAVEFIDGQVPDASIITYEENGETKYIDFENDSLSKIYSEGTKTFKLYSKAIKLEPNSSYCYPKTFKGIVYKIVIRSDYKEVDKTKYNTGCPETELENGWVRFKTPKTAYNYYLLIAFWKGTDIDVSKFQLINEDSIKYYDILASIEEVNDKTNSIRAYSQYDNLYEYSKKIQDAQTPSSLTIALMADTHYCSNKGKQGNRNLNAPDKLKTANTMGLLSNYVNVDLMANLGDLLAGNEPKEDTRNDLAQLIVNTNQNAKCPVLYVRGNHDDNSWFSYEGNSESGEQGTYRTDEMINDVEWYNYATAFGRKDIVVDKNKPEGGYGYYDHEPSKIRVIMLNNNDIPYIIEDDETHPRYGGYRYNSYQVFAFSNEQLNFVANALKFEDKEVPNDWAVLFLVHVPIDTTNDNGHRMGAPDPLIRGHQQLLEIVKAYRTGTSYSFKGSVSYAGQQNTGYNEKAEDFMVDINVDYSSKGVGDVIAFFNGHTHSDNYSQAVGYEGSLSHGYTYMGFWGAVDFATVVINREQKEESTIVDLFDDSVEWIDGVSISNDPLPLDTLIPVGTTFANYKLYGKAIKVKPNTTYKFTEGHYGEAGVYDANGAIIQRGMIASTTNHSVTTPNKTSEYYLVFSFKTTTSTIDISEVSVIEEGASGDSNGELKYTGKGTITAIKYGDVTPETFNGTIKCPEEEIIDGEWTVEYNQFRD